MSLIALASTVTLAIFSRTSEAQILGCDAAGCPLDQYGQPVCVIGNLTSPELGIANVTTAISPEPLTWTLQIAQPDDPGNSSQEIYSRNLYLGTPPSLDLQILTTVQGCALFFEGVSPNLAFPVHNPEYDGGTCSDAMNPTCVKDLMAQANSTLSSILANATDSGTVCQTLEEKLRDSAPQTCSMVHNGSWGTISIKDLTGPTSPPPTELGDCHPTTGKNYKVSLFDRVSLFDIESFTGPFEATTFIGNFMLGITPIMTIFFPNASNPVDGNLHANPLSTPELHLTCLKVVGNLDGCVGCGSSPGSAGVASMIGPTVRLANMTVVAVLSLISA